LKEGRAGPVIEVCQELLGQTSDPSAVQEITAIIQEAWKQEPPEAAESSRFQEWLGKMAPRGLRSLPRVKATSSPAPTPSASGRNRVRR
jgi:hypothetical protein